MSPTRTAIISSPPHHLHHQNHHRHKPQLTHCLTTSKRANLEFENVTHNPTASVAASVEDEEVDINLLIFN